MANSKARSKRPAQGARPSAPAASASVSQNGRGRLRHAHQLQGDQAGAQGGGTRAGRGPSQSSEVPAPQPARPSGQPLWLQVTSLVLAVLGLAISAYETYAHFNGNRLAGCPTGAAAPSTAPPSSPARSRWSSASSRWPYSAWRSTWSPSRCSPRGAGGREWRLVHQLRLASVVVGMGFVMYLIYAELQIGSICEYCTGVHIVTFLLFCITVFSAAIWGLGGGREVPGRRA